MCTRPMRAGRSDCRRPPALSRHCSATSANPPQHATQGLPPNGMDGETRFDAISLRCRLAVEGVPARFFDTVLEELMSMQITQPPSMQTMKTAHHMTGPAVISVPRQAHTPGRIGCPQVLFRGPTAWTPLVFNRPLGRLPRAGPARSGLPAGPGRSRHRGCERSTGACLPRGTRAPRPAWPIPG